MLKEEFYRKRQEFAQWFNSPEGKKAVEKALKNSREFILKIAESRKIDPQTLNDPMTI